MTNENDKPPPGLLAERAMPEEVLDKVATDTVTAGVPVDPNYQEPTPLAKYKEIADNLARAAGTAGSNLFDTQAICAEQKALVKFLIQRIEILETGLMPFSIAAMMMSNARMCLMADGRPDEPAGGTWLSNPPAGIQIQSNERIFFNACDILGRDLTHQKMMETFKQLQEAAAAQQERDEHLENGGSEH